MRGRLFFKLLLCVLAASVSRAQESSIAQPEGTQAVGLAQTAAVGKQAPPAKSQKREEEHPRLFGILPTYSVADIKSARPLMVREKFRLFVRDKTDPFTIGWVAFEAGLAQANNDFSGYGQGAAGYGKRFGAGLVDEAAGGFFGTFLFPSVLHQDPRYYRLGTGPFKQRLGHALIRPVLTHKDSGGRAFNWSGLLGSIATSSLSNAYYPEANRGVGKTLSRIAISIPFSMVDELVDEFGPDLERKIFRQHQRRSPSRATRDRPGQSMTSAKLGVDRHGQFDESAANPGRPLVLCLNDGHYPGNSGEPLVDIRRKLVGINSLSSPKER